MPDRATGELVLIDERNWRDAASVRVGDEQLRFVADHQPVALVILAKAHVRPAGCLWEPLAFTVDGHVVAVVALRVEGDVAEIVNLAVDVDHQRRGVGTALLHAVAERARAHGVDAVELTVHPDNARAAALYRRCGFTPTGEHRDGEPVWRLEMGRAPGDASVPMGFSDLADAIRGRAGPVRLVAIDGPGGAGKSTFADHLSTALDQAPVVHTDDFASADNPIDWWPRLLDQVITPLSTGRPARYQRYDWSTDSMAEWIDLPPQPVIIIEGVTAARSEWREHLAFVCWIETPPTERLRRGLERDGEAALDDWRRWGAAEDRHYLADPTREDADVVVDGTGPLTSTAFTRLDR